MKRIKANWFLSGLFLVLFIVIGYFFFVADIGFNSKYFVKRDFNAAFHARTSGNCDEFIVYVVQEYDDEWFGRCLKEKKRDDTVPIDRYEIKSISQHNNKAFLQVELTRTSVSEGTFTYTVNYEMERVEGKYLRILPWTRYVISQGANI